MIPGNKSTDSAFFSTKRFKEDGITLMENKLQTNKLALIYFVLDNNGYINALDGDGLEIAGISSLCFLKKNIYEVLPSENEFLFKLKTVLLSGESSQVIQIGVSSFDVHFSNSHDLAGDVTGIIGTAREISSEKGLREELMIHKGYFSQLFERSPEAIAIIDTDSRILNVNAGFKDLFDYSLDEIKGKSISLIVPEGQTGEASVISKRVSCGEIIKTETIRKHKDGSEMNVSALGYTVNLKDKETGICWIFSDITDRKRNENAIRNSLLEKEILFKEIHHRVKNNLQIIGSLLKFQAEYINDPEVMEIFKASQNRIKSISLIHEKLYQTKDLSRIEFAGYVKTLLTQLFITFGIKPDKISFTVNANNIFLSVDNAIPCGLIINELVTNSLKYGFPGNIKGHVSIDMSYENTQYTLKIADNGVGMAEDHVINKPKTLGLQLVTTLASQLDAQLELERKNGSCYTITFSNIYYKNRI